jgi:hypothetical protein
MNDFFYLNVGLSSNYLPSVEKNLILNARTLTFYLCGLLTAAFFSLRFSENISLFTYCRYLINLPFW